MTREPVCHFQFYVAILLLSICYGVSFSQNENLVLFDQASEANCEEISARIDSLAVNLAENNFRGYAVVYLGSDDIKNAFFLSYVSNYKRFRKYDDRVYQTITARGSDKPKLELWISKDGSKPPIHEVTFSYELPRGKETHFFVDDLLEIVRIGGKPTYLNVGCDCCMESLNWTILSHYLEANRRMKAYFIIRGNNASRAKQLERLILAEALDSRIRSNTLQFIYGGKNQISNRKFFEVSVFLSEKDVKSVRALRHKFGEDW